MNSSCLRRTHSPVSVVFRKLGTEGRAGAKVETDITIKIGAPEAAKRQLGPALCSQQLRLLSSPEDIAVV